MNNKFVEYEGLAFDDVLLMPGFTQVKREEIDLSVILSEKIRLKIPVISSPMDTVTESEMAISLGNLGGLGVIHRNMTIERQAREVKKTKAETEFVAAAVGTGSDLENRLDLLYKEGIDAVVIDSAHGYSQAVVEATGFISSEYPDITLISGSVATFKGAKKLIDSGAKGLRVGMGPGSICTTRIVAGIGVPQVTAITLAMQAAGGSSVSVIADGGIRTSGDIVKSLALGATCVMLGSLLAGCAEAPGEIVLKNGKKFKSYRGMGSVEAMKEGSAARYGQNYRAGQKKKLIPEGISGLVPYRGELAEVIENLMGGVRSGMYYAGAGNIAELGKNARFIKISKASLVESYPHDVTVDSKQ